MLEEVEARLIKMLDGANENDDVLRAAELLIQVESTRAFHAIPVKAQS